MNREGRRRRERVMIQNKEIWITSLPEKSFQKEKYQLKIWSYVNVQQWILIARNQEGIFGHRKSNHKIN
jgi:hypothetical protein